MRSFLSYAPHSVFMFLALAVLVGCGNAVVRNSVPSASEAEGSAQPGSPKPAPAQQLSSSADAATLRRGGIVFLRCRSCHSLEKDGPHLTGPNLNGLFGAPAAEKPGYAFSDALASSNVVWNAETLDAWIQEPAAFVPQNLMVFAGLPNAEDRAALIAYLAENTQ